MASSILNSDDGVISGTSGLKSTGGDDGVLVFQSKGTETARITSSANLVLNNAAYLQIKDSGGTARDVLTIDAFNGLNINSAGGGSAAPIVFKLNGTETARLTTDNYFRLASGGIQFNGDTAAANALDDYEEGTFTPTVIGTTIAGTATYNVQGGVYTKIGRTVVFRLRVEISALSGATGNIAVGSLPFSCGTQTAVSIGFANNLALAGSNYATAFAGGTSIEIYQYPVGGGSGSAVAIDTAFDIMIAGVYQL